MAGALIYAALGLLGLNTGLAILIMCNFGLIKAQADLSLPRGQAAWFLWVAGIAELFAAVFFFASGDNLDAATFGGFGLFWMGLGTINVWSGKVDTADARVLGPMAIAYAIFAIALFPVYLSISYVLGALLFLLFLVFLAIIPAAWGKASATVLGSLQLITFIIATIAIIGAVWYASGNTTLMNWSSWILNHPTF